MNAMEALDIDLHTHTSMSDGRLAPTELFNRAKENGVSVLAITDHNTTDGNREILNNNNLVNKLSFIPGVELSSKKGIHIVGLNVSLSCKYLEGTLKSIRRDDAFKYAAIGKHLENIGIHNAYWRAKEGAYQCQQMSPYPFARLLFDDGYVDSIEEGLRKIIDVISQLKFPTFKPSIKEAINLILFAGGVPILAESVAECSWNGWQSARGISGRMTVEYAICSL